jgi:anti-sigma factor RsiW
MTDPQCDQLDAYLCGWLSPHEAADFKTHLADCPACREECAVQQRIDRVMAEEATRAEPVPAVVADRIERGIRAARRRRQIGWASALTAAGILLALGLWGAPGVFSGRNHARSTVPTPVADNSHEPRALPSAAKPQAVAVRVTLVDSSSAILMPVESHSPNVTIVCVYPTTRVAREEAKQPSR